MTIFVRGNSEDRLILTSNGSIVTLVDTGRSREGTSKGSTVTTLTLHTGHYGDGLITKLNGNRVSIVTLHTVQSGDGLITTSNGSIVTTATLHAGHLGGEFITASKGSMVTIMTIVDTPHCSRDMDSLLRQREE